MHWDFGKEKVKFPGLGPTALGIRYPRRLLWVAHPRDRDLEALGAALGHGFPLFSRMRREQRGRWSAGCGSSASERAHNSQIGSVFGFHAGGICIGLPSSMENTCAQSRCLCLWICNVTKWQPGAGGMNCRRRVDRVMRTETGVGEEDWNAPGTRQEPDGEP